MSTPPDLTMTLDPSIELSLTLGDWAARCRNGGFLAQVVRDIYPMVSAPLQLELAEIGKLAHRDIVAAAARWTTMSAHLRAYVLLATQQVGKLRGSA